MTSWWLGNLFDYSLQVLLLITAGGLLAAVFRLREPRVRLAYLQTLLACCLLLPLGAALARIGCGPFLGLHPTGADSCCGQWARRCVGFRRRFGAGRRCHLAAAVVGHRDHPASADKKVGARI